MIYGSLLEVKSQYWVFYRSRVPLQWVLLATVLEKILSQKLQVEPATPQHSRPSETIQVNLFTSRSLR